jgi:poly-gamma-glutamate synthesis protein (capsule biosynthesis protein)
MAAKISRLSVGLLVWLAACTSPPVLTLSPTPDAPRSTLLAPRSSLPAPRPSIITLSPTPTPTPPPTIRLLFTGDINPGRCVAQAALARDDFTLPYQAVADELRQADITVGSLDGAISDLSPPAPCPEGLNLIGPARTVEGLQFAGFDVITVATNHAKDCGSLGWVCEGRTLRDTLRNLSQAGIQAVGGGETLAEARAPVIVKRQGVRFAFLGVSAVEPFYWATESEPGAAPLSTETLPAVLADIAAARAGADVAIVLPQWGVEYATGPTADQLDWAGQMMAAGATLVVGNHPHVVQGVETFPQGAVAYALGNFVFDQGGPETTRQGVVLEAVFKGSTLDRWELRPIHIYHLHQPRWAEPEEAGEILERVEEASAALPQR